MIDGHSDSCRQFDSKSHKSIEILRKEEAKQKKVNNSQYVKKNSVAYIISMI